MSFSAAFAAPGAPGTYVSTTTAGASPISVVPFTVAYLVGSSPLSNAPKNTPTRVQSSADFINLFGSSPSTASVDLFFKNSPTGTLFFINSAIAQRYEVAIAGTASVAAGTYTININGTVFSKTITGTDTSPEELAQDYVDSINAHLVISKEVTASASSNEILISNKNPNNSLNVLVTGAALTLEATTPTAPLASDYVYTLSNTFDPDLAPGFICAPEAFVALNSTGRKSVALSLEALASGNRYQWMALIDSGPMSEITNVDRAIAEAAEYASPQGHSAYYYPYCKDLSDRTVPVSSGIAGLALRRYQDQGFAEPPAGAQYILAGVKEVLYKATWQDSNIANPKGVNLILQKPNIGIVCYGARTLSTNTLFRFVSTRVILNIVVNSLRKGFDFEIFSSIGGTGQLLFDIQRKANVLLDGFWRAGLLYGQSPQQAYAAIADESVQIPSLLEQGIVNLFVWVVPATILERLMISVKRVAIGELEIVLNADRTDLSQQVEEEQTEE